MNFQIKKFFVAAFLFFFLFSCSGTTDELRLKRREILYTFSSDTDLCTSFTGLGAIRNSTPQKVIESMKRYSDRLGYIDIDKSGNLNWSFPWPFDDISEKVEIVKSADTVKIKGSGEIKEISFSSYKLSDDLAVLKIKGRVCKDAPTFIRENILSSAVKEVVKTVRDRVE